MADQKRPTSADIQASRQEYLAAELGHSVDHWGEPSGLERAMSGDDPDFREFMIALWRQVQQGRAMQAQLREMEREGLSPADLWAPGMTEFIPTSTSSDDFRRYQKKLLFRANILEALLTETVAELKRMERVRPYDADKTDG